MCDKDRRLAVAFYYKFVLDSPPPNEWSTSRGSVWKIMQVYCLSEGARKMVLDVLQKCTQCELLGLKYTGKSNSNGGQNKLILMDSVENQIIVECMEMGWSLTETMHLINLYRDSQSAMQVGRSSVHSAYLRLYPVVSTISPQKQGNADPNSAWAKARLGYTRQMGLRFRIWSWDRSSLGDPPPCFDIANLPQVHLSQIVAWDETHKDCKIGYGRVGAAKRQVRFPRNEFGIYDPNGQLAPPKTYVKMKYTKQARFSFGCATVETLDGDLVGMRCDHFTYSGKWINTIEDYEKLQNQEINRVKALPGGGLPWVVGQRSDSDGNFCECTLPFSTIYLLDTN